MAFFFFFSSRRRHTRSDRDWSSDVCSSDLAAIRRYLQKTRPTIVHTFLLTASLYGRLAAMLARVRIIIGTEVNIYEDKRPSHTWAERLLMAGTDAVVVSAASVKTFYERQVHADPAKVSVIYNAVDF